ncbi:sodium- and chloride-dependent glycine transporter 1-like [Lineus longissimus]|uniref:sodium- and chloride-dependent glycine transporter 1-like n=1 Tax=Lineus longissimus TaxID=88925 RepID=UPI002B4DE679
MKTRTEKNSICTESESLKALNVGMDPAESDRSDDTSSLESGDENTERGNWGGQLEFLLSCVGFAVGLGNIWRFPYLCMRNGGGAFLIPYFFFLFVSGIPLFIMELSIGQFSSSGPITVWNICPLFKGLGWGMVLVSLLCTIYYQTIISWVLYYLAMSFKGFTGELPWSSCNNTWNTENCLVKSRLNNNTEFTNLSEPQPMYDYDSTVLPPPNDTIIDANLTLLNVTKRMSPSEEFWQYNVLELSDGINTLGGLRWQLVVCHISGWLILFFCLFKGIKSTGKVVYVTATVPYLFLTALLIRGCMMPGALDGIKYYITPDFSKLLNLRIWAEACLQIFYSLGPAWGGMITFASYNKFHHNCYRDGLVVPLINCGTSLFAGFVIFSVIGAMAHEAGVPVKDAMTSGPGLAFIAYPEALTKLPLSALWSVFFFLMLLTIGLDTQFAMGEAVVSSIIDSFPDYFSKSRFRKLMVLVIFVICNGTLGLMFCTRAGMYFFQIWDWFSAAFALVLIAALESLVISWFYGMDRLIYDIEIMIGHKTYATVAFKPLWGVVIPFLMLFSFLYSAIGFSVPTYGDYVYPTWAIGFGWFLAIISLTPLPIVMVKEMMQKEGSFLQRLRKAVRPAPEWGPALSKYRKEYNYRGINSGDNSSVSCSSSASDYIVKNSEKDQVFIEISQLNEQV